MNMQQQSANIAVMAGAGAFLSFFTLATPILIHHISKKYVTQLNYNKLEDTYTANTYNFFLRKKEVRINFVQTCKNNIFSLIFPTVCFNFNCLNHFANAHLPATAS